MEQRVRESERELNGEEGNARCANGCKSRRNKRVASPVSPQLDAPPAGHGNEPPALCF